MLYAIFIMTLTISVLGYYFNVQDTRAQINWPEPDSGESLEQILAASSSDVNEKVSRAPSQNQNADETRTEGGSGSNQLKVIVHVKKQTAQVPSGKAVLTLTSDDGDRLTKNVTMPEAKGFFVTFEFGPGKVLVGEKVNGLVVAGDFEGRGTVTNSPDKVPEHMYMTMKRTND